MSGKFALIIGNTEYIDPGLAQLTAPGKDAEDFARVLKDQNIGAFDHVNVLLNQSSSSVIEAVDEFFDQKKPDDLLVLYFSGHGIRDELGILYLAVKNTNRARLRSTAIKSDYMREAMDQSRSKRQVFILDCCNSGTYAQGAKAATGVSIGTATAFESGYGRIILTANDATQFAWKGDKVTGETSVSLFTHFLVKGLEGEADIDGDGRITVDELYDYAFEQVRLATPKQTPSKFSSKQQGEIILRQSMRMEDIKPIPLPEALLVSIENPFPDIRLGAVQQLIKMLNGKNLGLARSARAALERIAQEDDSRTVSQSAFQALQALPQNDQFIPEQPNVKESGEETAAQLLAEQKAEEERNAKMEAEQLAIKKTEAARKAQEEKERLARERAEAERLARLQLEQEAAKREAERKAAQKAERLSAQKKLAEEQAAKAASSTVTPKLSNASSTYAQATRAPAKETATKLDAPSAKPEPFISSGAWPGVALLVIAAFALVIAVGGFIWWKASSNEPQATPPPLIAKTGSEATSTSLPTNTALFTPVNTAASANTLVPTTIPSPAATIAPAPTNAPEPTIPYFTANKNMNCREGPDASSPSPWQLNLGETVAVLAKWSGDANWLAVDINDSRTRTDCCWVNGSNGTLNVSSDQIKTTSIIPDRMNCSAIK